MRFILCVLVMSLVLVSSCFCADVDWEEEDRRCREASWKASYSENIREMNEGMHYFEANCKWVGDVPIAR